VKLGSYTKNEKPPVEASGASTLKDAMNEALRDWVTTMRG
jgi:tryptophan synthase beta subunit